VLIRKVLENDNALLLFVSTQFKELEKKMENSFLMESTGLR
jgi:hypothetical protein